MKRGALHFLGRKNQSLFDTNVKIQDMDTVELVLESSAIPESGTASVRARPTVNHHASSSETFQAFAVPTPKVPLLPPVNGPKTNGSVGGDHLANGSFISMPGLMEEEIFVPPPPSMAPPPPPGAFIPPPPDFMGDLNTLNLATLQSPTMPAPQPTSLAPFMEEEDLTFINPPPMAPPKPPSTCSSGSVSSVPLSTPSPAKVPDRPNFAPPGPPSERQHKTHKKPPPKPIRKSSMLNLDSPPETPAPPPPVQTPTQSTFNPQNAAKLYYVPQTSILTKYEEPNTRPKQMLLLEDSESVNSSPVCAEVDGKAPEVVTPSKQVPKDVQELMENLQVTQPSQSPLPEPNKEAKTGIVSARPEVDKPLQTAHETSLQLRKMISSRVNSTAIKDKPEASPSQSHEYSPIIDGKLRNLKNSETNGTRDGPAASPMALLMAAKERYKHKSSHPLSRENSTKTNEQPRATIHLSDSSPNSFIVTPRSSSSSSIASLERVQESLKSVSPVVHTQTIKPPLTSSSLIKDQTPSTSSALSSMTSSLVEQKLKAVQSPTKSQPTQPEELNMPLLPPPPEFDDFDGFMEPPPSIPPPDPPMKKAPTPTAIPFLPSPVPSTTPKPKPPAAPKLPPPDIDVKPQLQPQTRPKAALAQPTSTLSPSQATLLSILQKKMLEMDQKMAPAKEAESTSDDWGPPLSEKDSEVPVVPRVTTQSNNYPVVNKVPALNIRELEDKLGRKQQDTSPVKMPTSNGTQSKQQYGMTFTVRPGTKKPITLVSKSDP